MKELLEQCSRFTRRLDEIEPLIHQWAFSSRFAADDIKELMMMEDDPENRFPKTWHSMMAASRAASHTLTQKAQIQKFIKKYREEISDEAVEMLQHLLANPMKWTAFRVERKIDEDLYSIIDVLDENPQLPPLYSKGVTEILRRSTTRNILFIALLFDNLTCLQTSGIIHKYLSVTEDDLVFLCTVLNEDLFDTRGITGIINEYFITFFKIDEISEIPPMAYQGKPSVIIWRELYLEDIGKTLLPGNWDIEESHEGVLRFDFIGPDEELEALRIMEGQNSESPWKTAGMFPSYMYIIPHKHRACIYASSIHDYTIFTQVLSTRFTLDISAYPLPFFCISPQIWAMTSSIPDIVLPWEWFTEQFKEEKPESADDNLLGPINVLLREVSDAKNYGYDLDIPQRCRELGIELSVFESIMEEIEKKTQTFLPKFELSDDDKAFELSDLPVPPPSARIKFSVPLYASEIFKVTETEENYELFSSFAGELNAEMTDPGDMANYITFLFEECYDTMGSTVMNCLFYILSHRMDQWTPARSLGIEILKLYHHILIPGYDNDKEAFLLRFSQFVLSKLCTNGLLGISERPKGEVRKRGTYNVKPSVFYKRFIELIPDTPR